VSAEDSGNYLCFASTTRGPDRSGENYVTVEVLETNQPNVGASAQTGGDNNSIIIGVVVALVAVALLVATVVYMRKRRPCEHAETEKESELEKPDFILI
jgi:hypothetical protein